jgi:hypothetical protein
MNSIRHNTKKLTAAICLLVICSSLLVACGGSSDGSDTTAGIGGTGIVSGEITGFGSIHVNGGKFETDSSLFDVDGKPFVGQEGQDQLAVGMVVRLKVEVENGDFSSTALEVVYDDEIEGPVSAVSAQVGTTKNITVFGKTITIDDPSTLFEDATFNDIAVGNVVEVSGFRVSPTQINATYVERTVEVVEYGKTEVELRGTITDYDEGVPPGIPETFKIDGITIETDVNTEIEVPNGMLDDGIYVEVEGVIQSATSILAEEIESEDEDFDDDIDKISLEGVISNYVSDANFEIDGQLIDASGAQFSPAGLTLANGLNIEAEGPIIGGTLIADEVEEE